MCENSQSGFVEKQAKSCHTHKVVFFNIHDIKQCIEISLEQK